MSESLAVSAYIQNAPADIRPKLTELRKIIRSTVPEAEEKISYGIPYYGYRGRLAYFRYSASHIGLYIPPPVVSEFAQELAGFSTATSTVRLPVDKALPEVLIIKMIRLRMKLNTDLKSKKKK